MSDYFIYRWVFYVTDCHRDTDFWTYFTASSGEGGELYPTSDDVINPVKTRRICVLTGLSPYRAVNSTLRL